MLNLQAEALNSHAHTALVTPPLRIINKLEMTLIVCRRSGLHMLEVEEEDLFDICYYRWDAKQDCIRRGGRLFEPRNKELLSVHHLHTPHITLHINDPPLL